MIELKSPTGGAGLPAKTKDEYHHGKTVKRTRAINQETRPFVAWDGEGINIDGPGRPQSYVLFGSSEGCILSESGLGTFECLDYIIETGKRNPRAIHVGFAFTYDSNMIIRSLAPNTLARLHKNGWVRIKRSNGEAYTITFARSKYFRVTKFEANYHVNDNPRARTTVQIFDIFTFFACSFIKAYEDMVGPVPDIISTGKRGRSEFSLAEIAEVQAYWTVEIQLLRVLAEELRKRIYNAGLRITQWHGPGALASYAMRQHNIKNHMRENSPEIREAARYGYAGGRFELYKVGRIVGPLFGVDINSAYPHAIAQLPSMTDGEWIYNAAPTRVVRFGLYHVRIRKGSGLDKAPSPLFHRDRSHNISFPWFTDGWYFSPEAEMARRAGGELVESYEYLGSRTRPFDWIPEMYATRKDWKRRRISAQLALKLCLNSIYGKLAQRIGWDELRRKLPPFHQLEWAGWVTSYVRARLFNVMAQIPFGDLIAVETDGIYTTYDPSKLGIVNSDDLGSWEVTEYSEVLYVQSGLAWLRHTDGCGCGKCKGGWESKRRGLDPCRKGHHPEKCDCSGTFSLNACRDFLSTLHANPGKDQPWQPYKGETTRFIGLGHALASSGPFHERHCVWETSPRELLPGLGGKRIHVSRGCEACSQGSNAYEKAHDLVIHSMSIMDPHSYPHTIPWESESGHADWRDYAELQNSDVTLQYV